MKENNFYSDDFEQLIRGKTEQYKMYPSENVWKGVHSALHTKRKWFIGGMAVLVTGILFMAGRELIQPSHTIARKTATTAGSIADNSGLTETAKTASPLTHAPLAALHPENTVSSLPHTSGDGSS